MNERVSIIVPIYNTSRYLEQCINSLRQQTYKNLEIILVNDGSTDNSLQICKRHAAEDDRIIVIDKKNEGLELTRKVGYRSVTGSWVVHVDSDDFLTLDSIEILMSHVKDDVDIVIGSYYRFMGDKAIIKKKAVLPDLILDHDTYMEHYYKMFFGDMVLTVNMWARLYRKEMIDKIDIKNAGLVHSEDIQYNMQVFPHARKIVTTSEIVCYYRWGGMTWRMNYSLLVDARRSYCLRMKMLEKYEVKGAVRNLAFELKEFLKVYMQNFMVFTDLTKEEIIKKCEAEWMIEEMQDSVRILKEQENNPDEELACYLKGDMNGFYDLLHKDIYKIKIKNQIFKIITKLI